MEPLSTAIKFRDGMTLVVVWELHKGFWEILSIVRLRAAITLIQESPTTRLVFPTGVFPNGVWDGVYKNRTTPNNHQKADSSLQKRQRLVLELLKVNPGQTKEAIASCLNVSVATARQLLRSLEDLGDIHSRPHPMKNRTKLYYTGAAPTNPGRGATSNQSLSVRSSRSAPLLKIYFVDPRTLQPLNR